MKPLTALVGTVLPLLLTAAWPQLASAGQMSGTTMAPSSGQSAAITGTRVRGQVVTFTKTTLTLKLATGRQQTFQVTPRQMGQLKLHKGQTVTIMAKGNKAETVSTR